MTKRHFGVKDLYKFRFLSDPRISPDGTRIAYVLMRIDPESKEYKSSIYLYDAAGEDYCAVANGSRPCWSPDGRKLAYLSPSSGSKQVWVLDETLRGPRKLTSMRYGVSDLAWSPDGTRLLIVSSSEGEEDTEMLMDEMSEKEKEEIAWRKDNEADRIDNIYYRADEVGGILPHRINELWLMDMDTYELERITPCRDHIFSRLQTTPVWAPDGSKIAYTSSHEAVKELSPYLGANVADLYVYDIETKTHQRAVHGNGTAAYPVWAPDSQSIAYFWYDDLKYLTSSTLPSLHRIFLQDMKDHCLSDNLEISVHVSVQSDLMIGSMPVTPVWTHKGQILFWGSGGGKANVYAISDEGGEVQAVAKIQGSVFGMSGDAAGRKLALAVMDTQRCMELWECQTESGSCILCQDVNEKLLAECYVADAEKFKVEIESGQTIDAWLMKPHGIKENEQYPLVLHIHGGPHLLYGDAFNFEFQMMAAKGIGVLYANPRGSAGYGQSFLRGCCGDFGGRDYRDLMAVVDAALKKEPGIDEKRLGVTGLSYGGFMTNWVVGHTHRFKAAATKNCLSNLLSFSGVSDIGYFFLEGEQLGNPWKDRDRMEAFSPITYVHHIETPLLIMHTKDDQRCPIEQSEQLYTAMKYLGKDVTFLRYPSGNHLMYRLGKPTLRAAWLCDVLKWFEQHLLG